MSDQIIRAKDIMQEEIYVIDGMATANEAAAKFRSFQTTELLVAKKNTDDAWGIISIIDIVEKVIVLNRETENVYVYEIMTKPVITVPAQMDIHHVVRLMNRIGVRRTPVEDKGEIVGMITLYSLFLNFSIF